MNWNFHILMISVMISETGNYNSIGGTKTATNTRAKNYNSWTGKSDFQFTQFLLFLFSVNHYCDSHPKCTMCASLFLIVDYNIGSSSNHTSTRTRQTGNWKVCFERCQSNMHLGRICRSIQLLIQHRYVLQVINHLRVIKALALTYNDSFETEPNKTEYFVYNLPGTGNDTKSAKGSCGTIEQYIVIDWLENGQENTLNLTFHLNATTKEFSLTEGVLNVSSNVIPNYNQSLVFYHVGSFFEIPKDRSYYCTRVQSLNLTDSATPNSTTVGTFSVSHVLLEAFHSAQNKQYSSSIDCDAINTPGNCFTNTNSRWEWSEFKLFLLWICRYCANRSWHLPDCISRHRFDCLFGWPTSRRSPWIR